jgi:hypothetical protein
MPYTTLAEMMKDARLRFSGAIDVYSFGILLWELV